jgi:penicillin-binding protein 1A
MESNDNKNIYRKDPPLPPKKSAAPPVRGNPPAKGKIALSIAILSFFILMGAAAGAFLAFTQEIPELADLKNYKPNLSTAVYDKTGNLVSQLYAEQRTMVKLAEVPVNLQNAVIAKEDPRFYQHGGIDVKGIIRALFNNMLHGKVVEGGSTITQQLAKNLFLTRERTITRKIKETLLALQIEKYYTKQEIIELYCNQVYFGNGAYGVEAAARTYFGKHVNELTLPECAMLAALPQAPSQFNPYNNPEIAKEKRDVVIEKMAERSFITEEEKQLAIATPIVLSKLEVKNAPYFVEYVRQQLEGTYGNTVIYKGGLKVYTSLDSSLQDRAQVLFNKHIKSVQDKIEAMTGKKSDEPLQGSMIAMDPHTGEIKLMIGGIDYTASEYNRAVQAKRQTGSAFKPIIYTTAIENGFRVSDVIIDSPVVFQNENGTTWKPENFSGKFTGPMILLSALTHSVNVVTVKLLSQLGVMTAKKYARKLGITSPLAGDLTLGLGSSSVSLIELVTAFSAFANGGMQVQPLSILNVKDPSGKTLEQHSPQITEAIAPSTAYIMTYMMENVINNGTATIIRQMGLTGPCAGKTGTTNESTDAWFIGFTPDIVVGIWIGYDDKTPMGKNMTGGVAAAPLWAEFMMNTYGTLQHEFQVPDNIVFKKICTKSGKLATQHCPTVIDAPFIEGSEPTQQCAIHSGAQINNFLNEDMNSYDQWGDESAASGENGAGVTKNGKPGAKKPAAKKAESESDDIGGEAPAAPPSKPSDNTPASGGADTLNF